MTFSDMNYYQLEAFLVYNVLMSGLFAINLQQKDAQFSISSLMDKALPAIHPLVAAGSDKCEVLKSFLGITYEQMQEKNSTLYDALNIDLITRKGNVKYNLTASKRLSRLIENASSVVILIHGYLESSEGWMVSALAPELLKQQGLKILALDGRKVISLEYFRSSTYARFIGERLGVLLSDMVKSGQDPNKITLIGHSLGAHIAGIAGKKFHQLTNQLLGRITALDPAGICFSNVTNAGKIDRTDAAYVEVIHTNGGVFGLKEPVGHKDFYPNGGSSQPGCYLSTCDHSRAWEFYAETINSTHAFPARKCENWTRFREGQCQKNELTFMGVASEAGSEGSYFLTTGSSAPFGLGAAGSG